MAVIIQNPEEALEHEGSADPSRTNAVIAGVLFVVATAASLLSGRGRGCPVRVDRAGPRRAA